MDNLIRDLCTIRKRVAGPVFVHQGEGSPFFEGHRDPPFRKGGRRFPKDVRKNITGHTQYWISMVKKIIYRDRYCRPKTKITKYLQVRVCGLWKDAFGCYIKETNHLECSGVSTPYFSLKRLCNEMIFLGLNVKQLLAVWALTVLTISADFVK